MQAATTATPSFGALLRQWRERRKLSQLALALDANVSTKHVSFVESGRTTPSREMVLTLADVLALPLRAQNALLLSAGYAPIYPLHAIDDPALSVARRAVDLVLKGHEPYPAIAIDRHWNLVAANRAFDFFSTGLPELLLAPPTNVLRASLHPEGLAARIENLTEWRAHALRHLHHQVEASGDPVLAALYEELGGAMTAPSPNEHSVLVAQLRVREPSGRGVLSFISTTTMFGTPIDVTMSELAIESFFPADDATAAALHQRARDRQP